jgi:hypothetical protein
MSDDLEKIYRKFFDDSGKMKEAGTNILKKGMSDLKTSGASLTEGPKTLTEKGAFLPRRMKLAGADTLKYATKAAKATKYGKIALGVVGAGLAAKQYLKSKMSDDKKEEPKNTNASVKAKRLKELEGELNIDSKRGGGMIIARGNKLARSKPTKLY